MRQSDIWFLLNLFKLSKITWRHTSKNVTFHLEGVLCTCTLFEDSCCYGNVLVWEIVRNKTDARSKDKKPKTLGYISNWLPNWRYRNTKLIGWFIYLTMGFIWHLSHYILVRLWNHVRIRSWNQPILRY
mgnify:CR=1 FL=1